MVCSFFIPHFRGNPDPEWCVCMTGFGDVGLHWYEQGGTEKWTLYDPQTIAILTAAVPLSSDLNFYF